MNIWIVVNFGLVVVLCGLFVWKFSGAMLKLKAWAFEETPEGGPRLGRAFAAWTLLAGLTVGAWALLSFVAEERSSMYKELCAAGDTVACEVSR